ncbi:MAG: CoiA-like domain protein [Gemmatimonadales bacterium]|nr:CoiA-like domain protein [Gammaproteobacteria bacterium]MYC87657.1 CoiA-like domain protein [Candidatus Palauibacter denitrificans]
MKYALVNGRKAKARRGLAAICPGCGAPMVAKCGPRVIHHWAHKARSNCDPWWENETDWHREWKSHFPEECREVSHTAPDGEIHRADIKTPTGIVIEVQHSALSDEEREARERFYGNLIWILDGRPFRKSFELGWMLPDPESSGFEDIVWGPYVRNRYRSFPRNYDRPPHAFWLISEAARDYPGLTKANIDTVMPPGAMVQIHGTSPELEAQVQASYTGHHQFYWTRPRRTWLDANSPVYIDFGDEFLYRLEEYGATRRLCVRLVAKPKLVYDAMVERRAEDIATRFYPISAPNGG